MNLISFVPCPVLPRQSSKIVRRARCVRCLGSTGFLNSLHFARPAHVYPMIERTTDTSTTTTRVSKAPEADSADFSILARHVFTSFVVVKEPNSFHYDNISPDILRATRSQRDLEISDRQKISRVDHLEAAKYRLETVLTRNITAQTTILWWLFVAVVAAGAYLYQRTTGLQHGKAFWLSWCALSGAEPDFSGRH
jgi:hypothetical protein